MTVLRVPAATDLLLDADIACEASDLAPVEASWASAAAAQARLRAMVDAHFDTIYCALRRLGVPPGDLDDCAQQVFLVAAGKLAAIVPGRERAFLLGTAANVASHARRSQRRRREVPEPEEDETLDRADKGLRPDEAMEQKRQRAMLDEVLAAMPEDLRTVLVLFELEELTMAEIASALDLPQGTVASRLRRARETFTRLSARVVGAHGGRS
ncbi:RNA polymerase sigma factor [Polyangium aurulentum]|uniref:RNA polymerase sigma factor n=1 Tax=Polyangium aurulentum TaxID=2567896 RepID=UPI001F3B0BE7|nr:sigma-70 family RNA polymerase sigma factor [Polyangium aurulentum]